MIHLFDKQVLSVHNNPQPVLPVRLLSCKMHGPSQIQEAFALPALQKIHHPHNFARVFISTVSVRVSWLTMAVADRCS